MDGIWQTLWDALRDPFRYPVDVSERIFWGYLLSSLFLAVAVLCLSAPQPRRDRRRPSLLAFLFPKKIYLHKSAIADYQFFLVDRVVFACCCSRCSRSSSRRSADGVTGGSDPAVRPDFGSPWDAGALDAARRDAAARSCCNDFLLFYVHYIFHKVPALWEFHKVHHSAEVMTPLTAYRVHPFELFFTMNVTALVTALLVGLSSATCSAAAMPRLHGSSRSMSSSSPSTWWASTCGTRTCRSATSKHLSQVFVSPWMHQVASQPRNPAFGQEHGLHLLLLGPDVRDAARAGAGRARLRARPRPPASMPASTACRRCISDRSPISLRRWVKPAKAA